MKDQETRVLGRILAVEELDAVSGASTRPSTDTIAPPTGLSSGETATNEDTVPSADSGTVSDTTLLQDSKPIIDILQQP